MVNLQSLKKKMNSIYIVTAHRWGELMEHSYFVSCRSCPLIAFADSIIERNYRGGKYECTIIKTEIDNSLDSVPYTIIHEP